MCWEGLRPRTQRSSLIEKKLKQTGQFVPFVAFKVGVLEFEMSVGDVGCGAWEGAAVGSSRDTDDVERTKAVFDGEFGDTGDAYDTTTHRTRQTEQNTCPH